MEIVDLPDDRRADAVALWHAAGLTRPWNDPDADLDLALRTPSSTVLAALEGQRLVGTAMVGSDGHRGWVYYLAASPAGQGTGTALLRACEAWLADRGVPKVHLMVRTGNEALHGFYARLGYAPVDADVLGRRLS